MRLIPAEPIIQFITDGLNNPDLEKAFGHDAIEILTEIEYAPTVDAVEVVRCKDCRWAEPYERIDGQTGYYCMFCGNVFKYGTNWERLFTPIREAEDFCSYGERKDDEK